MKKTEMMNLIRKAKDRDPDAFTTLMQQYTKDMYRVAIAILMNDEDTADAIQETILDCWERIGTLREDLHQGKLPGQDSNLEKQDQNLL